MTQPISSGWRLVIIGVAVWFVAIGVVVGLSIVLALSSELVAELSFRVLSILRGAQ